MGFQCLIGMFDVVVCIDMGKKESWGKKGKKKKFDGEERENDNDKKLIFK